MFLYVLVAAGFVNRFVGRHGLMSGLEKTFVAGGGVTVLGDVTARDRVTARGGFTARGGVTARCVLGRVYLRTGLGLSLSTLSTNFGICIGI